MTDSTNAATTAIDPKVVERIRKTLNLSRDGGATEAEASLAAEMAQKLMRKYNLTLAEVEAGGGAGESGSKRTKQTQKGKAQYAFQQSLMAACAEVNFCTVLRVTETRNRREQVTGFVLIGREANVQATRVLYDYLNTTTERLAFEYVGRDNTQRLSRAAVSFKTGCAERLEERLRSRHQAAMEAQEREVRERSQTTNGTSLVVLNNFAQEEAERNNDMRWGLPEGTTTRRRLLQATVNHVYTVVMTAIRRSTHVDRNLLMGTGLHAAAPFAQSLTQEQLQHTVQQAVVHYLHELQEAEARAAETPAQRAKREERWAKESARYWRQQEREERDRLDRLDGRAYLAGSQAARTVGLDKQVDDSDVKGRLN